MTLLTSKDWMALQERLKRHEGFRQYVYDDATGQPIRPGSTVIGHPTIGYGRALDVRGIDLHEGQDLLDNSLAECYAECCRAFPHMTRLNPLRQGILVEMCYQNGIQGLRRFVKMHAALTRGDFDRAAAEMLDSKWARQDSPGRAKTLADLMRKGA